ncbi:immunoglobulin superfamily member 11 [Lepisosteus oculatus]|uniref:immunoglobulin superfamily member 11 n=1 Tax=Lepisosteus oculatus TaxID=7918 RepID=UPI0035F516F7
MGALRKLLLWTACLANSFLRKGGGVRVTVRETSVEVVRGDSVVLPCSFLTMAPLSRLNIIWTVAPLSDPSSPSQVIVYDHREVIESPAFAGRVGFVALPWSADIILNGTRLSDAGTYRCVVSNPPEPGSPGIGELSLTVLAPPSTPHCLPDGHPDEGGSVTLSCYVDEGVPTPQMSWDKLEPEHVSLPVNKEGDLKGTVRILNVSSQTAGLYRCSVSNPLGTGACLLHLSVHGSPRPSSGILQGVLLTLCMALVLLALLALVLWLHRSARERKWGHRRGGGGEEEEEGCYNEIRSTPTLLRRSFV